MYKVIHNSLSLLTYTCTHRDLRAREMQTIRVVITVRLYTHACIYCIACTYTYHTRAHVCTYTLTGVFTYWLNHIVVFFNFHRFCATAVLARFLIGIRALIVTSSITSLPIIANRHQIRGSKERSTLLRLWCMIFLLIMEKKGKRERER